MEIKEGIKSPDSDYLVIEAINNVTLSVGYIEQNIGV